MSVANENRRILVFTRAPVEGQVKTRLQPALSKTKIVELHKNLIHRTLSVATQLENVAVQLWVDSDIEHPFFCQLSKEYSGLDIQLQRGKDLGERMAHALAMSAMDATSTVLIGSDCPEIDSVYLQHAFDRLDHPESRVEPQGLPLPGNTYKNVVIGPATDGGYVLLATSLSELPVFTGIDWGSSSVFESTVCALKEARIDYELLDTLSDIDRPDDLPLARDFGLLSGRD